MVRLRSLLVALATAFAGGCFFVIDGLDDGERGGALECRDPDDCVGAALPCNTLDPAACGCGMFKRCESGRCSWVSVDCIPRRDAGSSGNAGACLKSADCEGAEKPCDSLDPAACGCGKFKRCQSGRCGWLSNECPKPDAGSGSGSGQCRKSAECAGEARPCDAPDPSLCGCGTFKWCQHGRCVGVSVDCIPGGAGSGGPAKCLKSADCPGAEPFCDAVDPAACGCGAFKRCESGVCTTAKVACPPVCRYGYDQTCNDDLEISCPEGVCLANGTCSCRTGTKVNPATGRCRLDPQKPDGGSGGPVKCQKSADCPGAEPLCDAADPAACGCGAFRRCESGLCTTAKVACPPVCKYGYDQTCNDDPEISFMEGVCLANGTCSCRTGTKVNPATGRCRLDPQKPDGGSGGPVKCLKSADCPGAEPLCDAADPAACGCGAFRRCESGLCTTAKVACFSVCKFGYDWECNDDPEVSSLEGVCLADGTCSCRTGTKVNPATGRCRLDPQKPDGGSGGPVKCLKSGDCPGAEPLCDAVDLNACGCGAFRRCESGLCTTAKVACPPVCKFGDDWSCNDDLEISSLEGVCLSDGTCSCRTGTKVNPATGRCRLNPQQPDAGSGGDAGECRISADCPSEAPVCEASHPVVCEYGKCKSCRSGRCVWTAADCSPPDAGECRSTYDCPGETMPCDAFDLASCGCGTFRRCEAGRCIMAKVDCSSYCTPGKDQTCNDDINVSSMEGVCLANGTCSCRPGTELNPATGRCRLK